MHKACRPLPGCSQISEPLERKLRPILGGAEQRLGEGIVITHSRARVGWLDAEPVQHGQHGCCFQSGAVIAVQHRTRRHGVYPLGEGRAPGQMRRVLGGVGVMHLKAHDLAAVEIEDQVQIEPAALDLEFL